MGIEDTPTIRHLTQQIHRFRQLLRVNRFLLRVGLGSKRIDGLQAKLDEVDAQLKEQTEIATKFNRYFADSGWLAHGLFDVPTMKSAVAALESGDKDAADAILIEYYGRDEVARRTFLFNGIQELRDRRRFIDLALEDYRAERYHAVVPVPLMIIDGATNAAVGTGFHADKLDLGVWDSITTADGSINKIKSIFQKSRRKTRTETISLPYRNGILHGADLGYDNAVVAAKCWCFLFVVADWIKGRQSEASRKAKFEGETRLPTLRELAAQMSKTAETKRALEAWVPRDLEEEYIAAVNAGEAAPGTPEGAVLEFAELWKRKNYGAMAERYCNMIAPNPKQYAKEIREQFGEANLISLEVVAITDDAPAISVVRGTIDGPDSAEYEFRLIRETPDGDPVSGNLPGGQWRIVWVRPCKAS